MKYIFTFLSCLLLFSVLYAEEARYYEKIQKTDVQCLLCPRECFLKDGQTGVCTVRKNIDGKLQSLVYAKVCSLNLDPIEKKPLFHFLPQTTTLSIATAGCNLRCVFCQNWSISQAKPENVVSQELLPEEVIKIAKEKHSPSISYTYSEPTVFYEYMYDTAFLAKEHGIRNVWVTSGYINPKPLKQLCTVLDAANVDLKGFSKRAYRKVAAAKFEPVLETLKILKENDVWLEVGYLVVPTLNDSQEEIQKLCDWIVENLGDNVPVHFLRFFPRHKLTNLPPTPVKTLETAYSIAKESGINYVYLGNVPGHKYENTYCPNCKKLLVERKGYFIEGFHIKKGKCIYCGHKISGIWE
ncbi:AmmeMemoRadiSam system radical SAM enzyme [Elusimicrobiota bacterium]